MAARKKREEEKQTAVIQIRVTPNLKKRLDDMAKETGISISEEGRRSLERVLEQWESN